MDLRSENPYWLLKSGLINTYPSLLKDTKTDIAIIGAGITGALMSWHLCNAGFSVIVLDRRHVAMGSTSASTSLLQYEIDTPLRELKNKVGEADAVRSYTLCRQSLYDLEAICNTLEADTEFELKPSFQYASFKKDVKNLYDEYLIRKKYGFDIAWLEGKDIKDKFCITAPGGVLSKDGAQVNAYALTHALLKHACKKGLEVFDNTEVKKITHNKKSITLTTASGYNVTARKIVIACGYESQQYITQKVEKLYSTYAIVSEPFIQKDFWYKNALIWETANPYLYLRTTTDNRILMGGLDDDFYNPARRDEQVNTKAKMLHEKFSALFPHLNFKPDFKWAGTFAGSKDGLPYIGSILQKPNTYFALGFGGNGITFSVIAAQLITDILMGKKNEDLKIFSFGR